MDEIIVDIDDLIQKLKFMKEDNYASTKLGIKDDGYSKELEVDAVDMVEESTISYGVLDEIGIDF